MSELGFECDCKFLPFADILHKEDYFQCVSALFEFQNLLVTNL